MTAQQAEIAARLFLDLMYRYRTCKPPRFYLFVITASKKHEPAITWEWRVKNTFGVSFARADRDAVKTWLTDAIQAGYLPFCCFRKHGFAFCPKEVCDLLKSGVG
jgi:hypothetical protein